MKFASSAILSMAAASAPIADAQLLHGSGAATGDGLCSDAKIGISSISGIGSNGARDGKQNSLGCCQAELNGIDCAAPGGVCQESTDKIGGKCVWDVVGHQDDRIAFCCDWAGVWVVTGSQWLTA